jgi:hypothetical protein
VDDPLDADVEIYRAYRAHELELNRATSAFEHAALAPLYLVNGGAVVAFLTLLGATSSEQSELQVATGWALGAAIAWSLGLLAVTLAARAGYESQRGFTKATRIRRQAMERELIAEQSRLRRALPYLSAEPTEDAGVERAAAEAWQERFLRFSLGSTVLFIAGILCAAVSVLL